MELTAENKLRKLIIVGDRVLIKPQKESEKTSSGIFLPPGVREKEKIQSGYIVKVGPGYPIPVPMDEDEIEKLVAIIQNPRQFKIPLWFLNRQKDFKTGKYTQVFAMDIQSGTYTMGI